MFFKKTPSPKKIPPLTKEKKQHYLNQGLTKQDIKFFRTLMAGVKEDILLLEHYTNQYPKINSILMRYHTLSLSKEVFTTLVTHPQRLHIADQWLYQELPSLIQHITIYDELQQLPIKHKTHFEAINQHTQEIETICRLMQKTSYDILTPKTLKEETYNDTKTTKYC